VTALFVFEYPGGTVGWCDLRHPIVDFTLDTRGGIWVSLDNGSGRGCVRVVEVSEAGEVVEKEEGLVGWLNEKEVGDRGVDFYEDLGGLQKWSGERAVKGMSRREEGRMKNKIAKVL